MDNRTTMRRQITALCMLLLGLLASSPMLAQNPAYFFASGIGRTGTDRPWASTIDANDNIYITGRFHSTVDFDPGSGTATLTSRARSMATSTLPAMMQRETTAGRFA